MLEGLDNVFDEIAVEDDDNAETESKLNVGYNIDDDVFTIQSGEPFFHFINESTCCSNAT